MGRRRADVKPYRLERPVSRGVNGQADDAQLHAHKLLCAGAGLPSTSASSALRDRVIAT